jgi:hypothetical protein
VADLEPERAGGTCNEDGHSTGPYRRPCRHRECRDRNGMRGAGTVVAASVPPGRGGGGSLLAAFHEDGSVR